MIIQCTGTGGFVGVTKNKLYDVIRVTHEDRYEFIDDNGNVRRFGKAFFKEIGE